MNKILTKECPVCKGILIKEITEIELKSYSFSPNTINGAGYIKDYQYKCFNYKTVFFKEEIKDVE